MHIYIYIILCINVACRKSFSEISMIVVVLLYQSLDIEALRHQSTWPV